MGKISNIEWTDATWNPWQGCHKVSAGCDNCYMYRDKNRFGQDPTKVVRSKDKTFFAPLKWKEPRKIFVCSWSDFFIEEADNWRFAALEIIKACPQHVFIILTKRTDRIIDCFYNYLLLLSGGGIIPNAWFLASVENQEMANKRIPELLRLRKYAPWPVLGISVEPMLGEIDLYQAGAITADGNFGQVRDMPDEIHDIVPLIDWIICGSESGPGRRVCKVKWIRDLKNQCVESSIPFFLKQSPGYINGWPCIIKMPELDGKIWNQMPEDG